MESLSAPEPNAFAYLSLSPISVSAATAMATADSGSTTTYVRRNPRRQVRESGPENLSEVRLRAIQNHQNRTASPAPSAVPFHEQDLLNLRKEAEAAAAAAAVAANFFALPAKAIIPSTPSPQASPLLFEEWSDSPTTPPEGGVFAGDSFIVEENESMSGFPLPLPLAMGGEEADDDSMSLCSDVEEHAAFFGSPSPSNLHSSVGI